MCERMYVESVGVWILWGCGECSRCGENVKVGGECGFVENAGCGECRVWILV